jgi:hypothetical protein
MGHDEWSRQDVFAIANSGVFVPVISVASLEQWSFEKRAPTSWFACWLAVLMVLLAFVELFNDGLLALFLSQHQEQMYLCYTVVFSLVVPAVIHTFVVRQLFVKESRGKNQAFMQWMDEHQAWLPLLLFLGAIRPDLLRNLLMSGAFGWSVFQCPLSTRSARRLLLAGASTNLLHDLPQLLVSIILLHYPASHRVKGISPSIMRLLTAGMTLSSTLALIYSLFSRLSAALLLRATNYAHAGDVRDDSDVDEMMMEYMTALGQQAYQQDKGTRSRSTPQSPLKLCSSEGLPHLIVPLVIDEIFETSNNAASRERMATAADAMLLHPIGDNRISTATLRTHDQIMRRDLDLHDEKGFTRGFANVGSEPSVSGVLGAILGHCAVDEERGGMQVFTVQRDRWGRCDAAAEHVIARLRSIGNREAQSQTTQDRNANTKVQRILATPSSLKAHRASIDESLPPLLAPLLQQHSDEQPGITTDETKCCHAARDDARVGDSFNTASTYVSSTSSSGRSAGASTGGACSQREFSSCTTGTSMSGRSAHSAGSFKTSSLNGGEGGGSVTDSASVWSYVTAEEA